MKRTARVVLATGVALSVIVPISSGAASAAPAGQPSTTETTITVVDGDSLSGLAWRHGVRLSALLRANSLELTTIIHPGDTLVIPAGASAASTVNSTSRSTKPAAASNGTGSSYTVEAGDALFLIAWRHGVTLGALLQANDMSATDVIIPGQRLRIPPATRPAPTPRPSAASAAPDAAPSTGAARSSGSSYTVVAGDALFLIAMRHGVTISALLRANDISLTSTIFPGQRLQIPPATRPAPIPRPSAASTAPDAAPSTGAARSSGSSYTVVAGDALFLIAMRHGVTISALLRANDISLTSTIFPGQRLQIPPATRPAPTPRTTASSATPEPTAVPQASTSASSLQTMLSYATAQVGAPYKFFSAGPDAFDCSGLVVAAFRQVGISVPHQSRALARLGESVDWRTSKISAGDLVFTSATNDPNMITHVGIALDSQRWVQAVGHGRPVTIGSLPSDSKIMAVQRIGLP